MSTVTPNHAAAATPHATPAYEDLCLYIDGQFLKGDGRKEQDIINPATGKPIAKLPHATTADLDRALQAAQKAFETWRHSSPLERSRVLRKVAELTRERFRELALKEGEQVFVKPRSLRVFIDPSPATA